MEVRKVVDLIEETRRNKGLRKGRMCAEAGITTRAYANILKRNSRPSFTHIAGLLKSVGINIYLGNIINEETAEGS